MSNTPSLLGPSGSPLVELGGDKAWLYRQLGDIVCSYQWLDVRPYGVTDSDGPEACMVLFSATRRMDTAAKVIRAKHAWMWVESTGKARHAAFQSAIDGIEALGFDRNDRAALFRFIDIVTDGIADLVRMPSDPPEAAQEKRLIQGIETHIRIGGKTVHSEVR